MLPVGQTGAAFAKRTMTSRVEKVGDFLETHRLLATTFNLMAAVNYGPFQLITKGRKTR